MRTVFFFSIFFIANILSAKTTVTWENLGNNRDNEGDYYVQRFTIKNVTDIERLCFNQFARKMRAVTPGDTIIEIVPGYYYIESPRFGTDADSVVIDIRTKGSLMSWNYAPDGVHVVKAGNLTEGVDYTRKSIIDRPEQWSLPGIKDRMPYGDDIYRFNETLITSDTASVYDMIPSFKSVTHLSGISTFDVTKRDEGNIPEYISYNSVSHENPEYYRITIKNNAITVDHASTRAKRYADHVINRLLDSERSVILPDVIIEDYPDLPYRAIMIDVARNFRSINDMREIVSRIACYKINTLHFHITDDEAWRLEIPGLPELTTVGARRGYTLTENEHLAQIFTGDGNPDNHGSSSNGYYTRDEFITFIKACQEMGVDVIPEIESPGHARAAIKAMEARYRNTGDSSYRLIEDGDTSRYTSAQAFHDNVMNPALPGPYRFMEKVISEIVLMYDEAGVPLKGIHIGGDEVPRGAWSGSPAAQAMIASENLNGEKGLHAAFVSRISKMLSRRGIPMYGWQEIAVGHTDEYNAEIAPLVGGVNCWSTLAAHGNGGVTREAVEAGYPVILSNVNHFYLDMTYSYHPDEKGLNWGGTVDEFNSFAGYVDSLCPATPETKGKVVGISGQIFAETMRDYNGNWQIMTYLFPKMLGLSERAWNTTPTYSQAMFNKVVEREIINMVKNGSYIHVRQPGIIMEDDMIKMNSPYTFGPGTDAEIYYTTDGSEPTRDSQRYISPIPAGDIKEVRAKLYILDTAASVTSILYLK